MNLIDYGRKWSWSVLRYCPSIFLEEPEKRNTKNLTKILWESENRLTFEYACLLGCCAV
jgi:hypothetical protein